MFIKRSLAKKTQEAARHFPVIAVLGPRQSGKTTLVQQLFKKHVYVSLEDVDMRTQAQADPRRFLAEYINDYGVIIDEIQHAPELLSYIQTLVDREKRNGRYIITGSQNLLVNKAISQTLAGRIAVITLLPLSLQELAHAQKLPKKLEDALYKGSYPKIYAGRTPVETLYANYLTTYVERDVRQIKNIGDLKTFQRFMQLCAGRVGQLLNMSSLGNDCGIDHKTVKSWLSILEASYLVVLLQPYYKNFGKRLIQMPKLYFLDTGLLCSLLRIRSADMLREHYLRGNLFENYVIVDLFKQYYNLDIRPPLYFWRDQAGHEVDCVIEQASTLVPLEIKSGMTVSSHYFDDIDCWNTCVERPGRGFVVYGGDTNQGWPLAQVLSWRKMGGLVKKIEDE